MACAESKVTWSIYDILLISVTLFLADFAFVFVWSGIAGFDSEGFWNATKYFVGLTGALLPVLWVKMRYGSEKSALGLTMGLWGNWRTIAAGILSSVACALLSSLLINGTITFPTLTEDHVIAILTAPISLKGIPLFILAPIAEEIYFRGLLYGYLVKRLGELPGLVIQAILFSSIHFYLFKGFEAGKFVAFLISAFAIGIILGLLYRLSRSLYPPMLFHGVYNYLAAVITYGARN